MNQKLGRVPVARASRVCIATNKTPLCVGVLVDLERHPAAGGHVKFWERIGAAVARNPDGIDLTVHFQGDEPGVEHVAPNVRFVHLPPVFSTRRIKWLSTLPDHTDLAPRHNGLASLLGNYDVLHTTDAYFAYARTAESYARGNGIPLVTSLHTNTPALTLAQSRLIFARLLNGSPIARTVRLPEYIGNRMQRRLIRHLKHCRYAHLSEGMRQLGETAGCCGREWGVLRRGIDRDLFHPAKRDRSRLLEDYGISSNSFLLCYVGRIDASKQVGLLADAAVGARNAGVPVHVVMAGEGGECRRIQERLDADVTFTGFLGGEELARVYASADVLVFPSRIEIAPNVVLEAKASGLPVMVTKEGGGAMVRENGTDGIVLASDEADEWADGIERLYRDGGMCRRMGRSARGEVERHRPTWDEVLTEDLLPVWRKAANVAQASSLQWDSRPPLIAKVFPPT